MSLEFFFRLNMKMYTVTMKMSAKFASEAMNFEPFTLDSE